MSFPAKQKTWTITANNAIAGASLNVMMGIYLKLIADFLLANGYTCKGSSDGATAAMDGVNRWVTAANAGTRGATTATAQSWMALTDGNGCNLLLAYTGASDDIAQISFSPSGIYVVAGTATFTPTATDGVIMSSASTVIGNTSSATNRTQFGWVDSTAKLCRFLQSLNSTGSPNGCTWGLELIDSTLQSKTITPSVWGFAYGQNEFEYTIGLSQGISGTFFASTRGGNLRVNGTAVGLNMGVYQFGGTNAQWAATSTELQGSIGAPIWGPWRLATGNVGGFTGLVGTVYDWWSCQSAAGAPATVNLGDTLNAKAFMVVGLTGGIMWPWDGSTTPANGSRASQNITGNDSGSQNAAAPSYGSFMDGASTYVPLPNSNVTPTGPTAAKSIARRGGVDVIRLRTLAADPSAETGKTLVYTRLIAGQQALFCRYPDGTVYQVGAG